MCEHLPDRRRYVGETDEEWAARNPRERVQGQQFACRINCDECASALKARLVGDIWAEKATSDRDLFVTLTYDDREVSRLADEVEGKLIARFGQHFYETRVKERAMAWRLAAANIDAAKDHFSPFVQRMRDMLRRLHPDLVFEVRYFRIAEYGDERGRVHWHCILSFRVDYRDALMRAAGMRPEWSDELIPRLYLNTRYLHEWETIDEEFARKGKKTRQSIFPSRIPWPFGFIFYQNCEGGDGDYLAGYATKAIEKQVAMRKRGYDGTEAEYEELRKSWQSFRSKRRSKRYGQRFYADQGRETAYQGLPANTYFKVPMGAKRIPGNGWSVAMVAGSDRRRFLKLSRGADGQLMVQERMKFRQSADFMLTGSGGRTYLDAYDEVYQDRYGDRPHPIASCVRTRKVAGTEKQYYGYGIDEARIAKQKSEWAAEDHRHLDRRQRLIRDHPNAGMRLTVAEDLEVEAKDALRIRSSSKGSAASSTPPSLEEQQWFRMVESWREKYWRDQRASQLRWDALLDRAYMAVVARDMPLDRFEEQYGPFNHYERHWREQGERRRHRPSPEESLKWFQGQPALAGWPGEKVRRLWKAVLDIEIPPWRRWRKGEGGNGYSVLASGKE